MICTNRSRAAFLIGRSVHQAQLSVSFETVVSSFPHHFPCSLLCEHREEVQQCCRLLFVWWESPSPLLVTVSLFSARQDRARSSVPAYPLNVKSQSSKSLPGACGSGFPTLMSSGRGFDTDCPIVLTASASPDIAAFIAVLDDC